jgi:YggT family protein
VRASSASVIGDQAELYGRRGTAKKPEHAAVGGLSASILLADWVSSAQNFVQVFTLVYFLLIFAYILMSWVRLPYSIWVNRIQRFLYDVCEPYIGLFRRVLPPLGPIDLSPAVAIIVLIVLQRLVVPLID